ncbi:Uncharacterized protein APZ42_002317, partial [Daphnia magna]
LANSNSSYSSVNTSRSMLSSTLDPIDGYKIGEHPTVVQLLKGCSFSPTAASFSLTQPKKAQHSGPLKSFVLPRFKGKCCPVECLESYVAISREWRDPDSSALFLSIRRPHKPVGSSTLGRWIKTCLSYAGLDPSSFSAHSTRGAAASKAVGIPVDTVLKTANWSRESTFKKFYHRELVGTTVTEAV